MFEVLLDNRNGNTWNLGEVASDITWKTSRIGKPGGLEFTLIKNGLYQDPAFQYNNGDIVSVRKDGVNVFRGYIFSIDTGRDEAVKITAYDQIRYLMNKQTYAFENVTAAEVLKKIAGDFQLKLGRVEDTRYRIPAMLEDGQTLIDIICKALTLTLIHGGENYFLFDDFGELSLRKSSDHLLDFYLGTRSLMVDYSASRSIDSDTYNRIKLYKDNNSTGKREIYEIQDSSTIAKWGILQMYESVDENKNTAQINELLTNLMILKNRETKSLKLEAIGDTRVRAGCYVLVVIEEFNINQPFLIEECTHRFDGANHTMSLELKVI